jgi:three-Cys-motif partner protein
VHFYNVEAMANPPRATIWSAEPHTFAKHRVLRRYLDAWIPIMGQSYSGRGRVIVIDGFAGPGEYVGGEEGSLIIALRSLLDHAARDKLRGQFVFIFVEEDQERYQLPDAAQVRGIGSGQGV